MARICLVTALCDPDGELLDKAHINWAALTQRFERIAFHVTDDTLPEWFDFLNERGVPVATAEPAWDHIGLHRRRALELGLQHTGCRRLFYADPDHIPRWTERQPADLDRVLAGMNACDCLVVGRTERGFAAAPERLRATESIVNHIFALIANREWDVMMAARGLSRRAAELIVRECSEDTLGNDVAWPLLIADRGMNLDYTRADGLTYETNTVYARAARDCLDADPAAWMLRVYAANQHVDAMRPFLNR